MEKEKKEYLLHRYKINLTITFANSVSWMIILGVFTLASLFSLIIDPYNYFLYFWSTSSFNIYFISVLTPITISNIVLLILRSRILNKIESVELNKGLWLFQIIMYFISSPLGHLLTIMEDKDAWKRLNNYLIKNNFKSVNIEIFNHNKDKNEKETIKDEEKVIENKINENEIIIQKEEIKEELRKEFKTEENINPRFEEKSFEDVKNIQVKENKIDEEYNFNTFDDWNNTKEIEKMEMTDEEKAFFDSM